MKKAITYSCDISLPLYLLKRTLNSYVTILAIQSAFLITADKAASLSESVEKLLSSHDYPKKTANHAALFVEEIGLTILEKNKRSKKPLLFEISLFFEDDSVFIIERDSGKLFDLTDPDLEIKGLSGYILSGLMESHKEKAYLVTTSYNRNMIRFSKNEKWQRRGNDECI